MTPPPRFLQAKQQPNESAREYTDVPSTAPIVLQGVEITQISDATRNALLFAKWARQGVVVRRMYQNPQSPRPVEALSKNDREVVGKILTIIKKHGMTGGDVLMIELCEGLLLEVPRQDRRVIFKDQVVTIMSPDNIRTIFCGDAQDAELEGAIEEALMCQIDEHGIAEEVVVGEKIDLAAREKARKILMAKYKHGVPSKRELSKLAPEIKELFVVLAKACGLKEDPTVDEVAYTKMHGVLYWSEGYASQKTDRERSVHAERASKKEQVIIDALKKIFPSAADLCYLEPEDVEDVIIGSMDFEQAARRLGFPDVLSNEDQLIRLAGRVFGNDNPTVARQMQKRKVGNESQRVR